MNGYTALDLQVAERHGLPLVGLDEVGVGPVFGPVCACALMVDPEKAATISIGHLEVNDSKKLTEVDREALFVRIAMVSLYSLGWVGVGEIESDRNIQQSAAKARERALHELLGRCQRMTRAMPKAIISDWFDVPAPIPCVHPAKADSLSMLVACASIVAKVMRDREVIRLAESLDVRYDLKRSKGYGTPNHMRAIRSLGLTPHHRVHMIKPPQAGWKGMGT
jgi:ribonuclease HII